MKISSQSDGLRISTENAKKEQEHNGEFNKPGT